MRARTRCWLAALMAFVLAASAAAAEPRFDGYEIRVIRPRYFIKTGKVEMAAGLGTIVNQTFIYSFLATGLLTYHFSETLALEGEGGYAANVDRSDKQVLNDDFAIKTILLLPQSIANARAVWTPSYGKFNLTSSNILHFETNVFAGAGTTGMHYLYDYCETTHPSPKTVQYPTYVFGASQRYFLDTSSSLRLGIEDQRVMVNTADAACIAGAPAGTAAHDDLLLFMAWSYFL